MMKYAVYLTIYSGNLLPPFYIGHSSVKKLKNGYRGSVSSKKYKEIWKKEILENPNKFRTFIISYAESKEKAIEREIEIQLKLSVHRNPLYSNSAIANLKFYHEKHTQETKILLSDITKKQFADEEKRKRHLDSFLEKDGNHRKKIWINNGNKNKRVSEKVFEEEFENNGWKRGRIFNEETPFWVYDKTGENNPFYGKKHTEKTVEKLKQRPISEESRKVNSKKIKKLFEEDKQYKKNYLKGKIVYNEKMGYKTWKLKLQLENLENGV